MTDFSSNIILVIAVTSIATYLSRSLGVLFSERIDDNSKIFRLFDCIAYSTLAALISKVVVFPAGDLGEASNITRLIVVFVCVAVFFIAKRNLVYPTVLSAILLTILIKLYKKMNIKDHSISRRIKVIQIQETELDKLIFLLINTVFSL